LIEAAGGAGVEKFVFISFKEAGDTDYPLNQTKRKVERALSDSNMNWTSLQSAYFMEVWLSPALGFDYVNQAARIYGSGENGLSWISYRDVAKFAVEALSNPIADRTILEIGGPEKLSPNEVLKIFERIFGKSFAVERIPIDALKNQKQAASNPLEESFAGLMIQYAKGDEIDMESLLEKVQIDLLSVQDYAQTLAKSAL
ncbi:MAG: NmrA family NAD(P)-binding protein, partial [Saprospiraceae bacterium]|nr:NmrA family NAD(P)-binding protein [Saprospiraceae bacterium]